MSKVIAHDPAGREVWCYGDISWDSNFDVVCENEYNDCLVPGLDEEPKTWNEAIALLYKEGFHDMEQVETC